MKLCTIELEKPQHLLEWLHNAEELNGVQIYGRSTDDLLMRIEHIGPKKLKVIQKMGFPFTALI